MPDYVLGDRVRVRQVITNLVGNAIKFTERGRVTLGVSVDGRDDRHVTLHLRVTDTGIGIPADKHETIFAAFSQADGSTTRRFGGTGLGLSISAKLVDLMGGRIWVESEPGVGSVFHVVMPVEPAVMRPDDALVNRPIAAQSTRRARVLLAEDNAINQRIAVRVLGKAGHQVTVVETGAAAVEATAKQTFDIVLMDLQMPDMGGFEATRLIRARERLSGGHVRIVAMTAHAMAGDRERCLAAGMDGHLTKPVDSRALAAAVADRYSEE